MCTISLVFPIKVSSVYFPLSKVCTDSPSSAASTQYIPTTHPKLIRFLSPFTENTPFFTIPAPDTSPHDQINGYQWLHLQGGGNSSAGNILSPSTQGTLLSRDCLPAKKEIVFRGFCTSHHCWNIKEAWGEPQRRWISLLPEPLWDWLGLNVKIPLYEMEPASSLKMKSAPMPLNMPCKVPVELSETILCFQQPYDPIFNCKKTEAHASIMPLCCQHYLLHIVAERMHTHAYHLQPSHVT